MMIKGLRGGMRRLRTRQIAPPQAVPDVREPPPLDQEGNRIRVDESLVQGQNLTLRVTGDGNLLDVAKPFSSGHLTAHLEGQASISIGPNCIFGHLFIYAGRGAQIAIGHGVGFNGHVSLLAHEPLSIRIGDECLFADSVVLTVSDMHGIQDLKTGRRLNFGKDVSLAERVWVGRCATILKGVTIGGSAVIGAGAVVTRDVPGNCIAAGNPARIVRRGVSWTREL